MLEITFKAIKSRALGDDQIVKIRAGGQFVKLDLGSQSLAGRLGLHTGSV
jgi:hypothetical protein